MEMKSLFLFNYMSYLVLFRSVSLMSPENGEGLAAGLPPSTPSKGGAAADPSPLQHFVQVGYSTVYLEEFWSYS